MPGDKLAPWLVTAGMLAALPAALIAQPTEQLPRDKVATLCWPELVKLERFNRIDPIPVGCELNGCCPGCPKPELIVWRILLKGGPVESAELEFDNLTGRSTAAFDLGGTARQEGDKIIIGKGEAIVRGLPALPAPGQLPAVGRLQLRYDTSWGAKGNAKAAKEEMSIPADTADAIELIVEQRLGDVVVNEYLLRYNLRHCAPHESDTVTLLNNGGGDRTLLLIDARKQSRWLGSCENHMEQWGNSNVNVGKLTTSLLCRSEITAFSKGDQMMIKRLQPDWTSSDDVRQLDLPPPLNVKVLIWLARPNAEADAQSHVDLANALYDSGYAGIRFEPRFRQVASADKAIVGTKCTPDVNPQSSGALGVLGTLETRPEDPLFQPKMLNVYYVSNATLTGQNCGEDRNIQYIGTGAHPASLGHEFGHSMGLGHTRDYDPDEDMVPEFGADNLVWSDIPDRCCLSEGQAFRLNVHCTSTLNLNGTRTGLTRKCGDTQSSRAICTATDAHCPVLEYGIDIE